MMITRILIVLLACLMAACTSSGVRAPVVGSSVDDRSLHRSGGIDSNQTVPSASDPYLQSNPLPSKDPLTQQVIPNDKPVASPVLRRLLAQAEVARTQKQWEESEVHLERALRIDPKNALVWHRMALVKLQQNKNNQAIQFASKSNTLARGDNGLKRRNWSVIAEANTALNRPVKAVEARRKAQEF